MLVLRATRTPQFTARLILKVENLKVYFFRFVFVRYDYCVFSSNAQQIATIIHAIVLMFMNVGARAQPELRNLPRAYSFKVKNMKVFFF